MQAKVFQPYIQLLIKLHTHNISAETILPMTYKRYTDNGPHCTFISTMNEHKAWHEKSLFRDFLIQLYHTGTAPKTLLPAISECHNDIYFITKIMESQQKNLF